MQQSTPNDPTFWVGVGVMTGMSAFLLGVFGTPLIGVSFIITFALMLILYLYADRLTPLFRALRGLFPWFTRTVAVLTLTVLVMAALYYSIGMQRRLMVAAVCLFTGGMGLAMVYLLRGRPVWVRESQAVHVARRTRWLVLFAGIALLGIAADASANVVDPAFIRRMSSHLQFVTLVVGVCLIGWGLAGKRLEPRQRTWHFDLREGLALGLILLVATVARGWMLQDAFRLFVDEIHFSNPVMHFYWAHDVELLRPFSSVAAFPYIYPYMQWFGVEVFGRNLIGLRAVSALFGVLTVWAVYLLGKELFDAKTGLLGAALLAALPVHIQFSRLGLNNIADPFFGVMAVYFLARGMRREMRPNFAWAGVMIGLTQYFYEGGRLLFPPLAVLWLAITGVAIYSGTTGRWAWAKWRDNPSQMRSALARISGVDFNALAHNLLVFGTAAILVSIPVYYTLAGLEKGVLIRLETAGINERTTDDFRDPGDLVTHIVNRTEEAFLIHVAIPEGGLYYAGETGFLLVFVSPFFFIGAFALILRLDRRESLLLLLWIALTWLGNTLMRESRLSPRYVVAFPALALVTGLGIRAAIELFLSRSRWRNLTMVGVAGLLVAFQLHYYFVEHLPTFNHQFRGGIHRMLDMNDVLFRAVDLPPNTRAHAIADPIMIDSDADQLLRFLSDTARITTLKPDDVTDVYLQMQSVTNNHAFFIDPDDSATLARIFRFYPDVEGPFYSPYDDIPRDRQFVLYYQPAQIDLDDSS